MKARTYPRLSRSRPQLAFHELGSHCVAIEFAQLGRDSTKSSLVFCVPRFGFMARSDCIFADDSAVAPHCCPLASTCSCEHFLCCGVGLSLSGMEARCFVSIVALVYPLAVFSSKYRSVIMVWHIFVCFFVRCTGSDFPPPIADARLAINRNLVSRKDRNWLLFFSPDEGE